MRPLTVALSDPIVTRDRQRTQQLVDEAGTADRDVAYVIAVDANGIVLAATDTSLMGQTLKRDDFERSALDVTALTRRAVPGKTDLFETAAPISYAVLGKVGVLRVGVSTAAVTAAVRQATTRAMVVALVALAVGVAVCVIVARKLVHPAGAAALQLRELASGDADLTQRLGVRSRDEFGRLSESFTPEAPTPTLAVERRRVRRPRAVAPPAAAELVEN